MVNGESFDEDRYYDAMLAEEEEKARVPFADYCELEEENEKLKQVLEAIRETVLQHRNSGDWKYLREELSCLD